MDDISVKHALTFPLLLLAAMLSVAAGIGSFTGVDGTHVFLAYVAGMAASTLIAILVWMFVEVVCLAAARTDKPIVALFSRMCERQRLFVLPAIIFPLFLGGYTWAKVSIPFAVGYSWEQVWVDADRSILGADAWVYAHALSPAWLASSWTFFYSVVWTAGLLSSGVLISVFASRRFAATFYSALMLSWLIGGILLAYSISAAGPVFAHLTDPALGLRFAPLRAGLLNLLNHNDPVIISQRYLESGWHVKMAFKGGGISAMPSMHVATATILMLAARGTRWFWISMLFLVLTFFGSVYLGYHYAIDAPVAAIVAIVCWAAARRIHRGPVATSVRSETERDSPSLAASPASASATAD